MHRSPTGLDLALADGSVFRWDPGRVTNPVAPPAVVDGTAVWIDYSYEYGVVCPFCGAYHNAELRIVDCADGKTLWIGREGHTLGDIGPDLVGELFKTTAHERLVCTLSGTAGCHLVERSVFDHVLDTNPAQVLHHGNLERVVTPGGEYDVVWAHSTETSQFIQNCNDGPGVASDTGFAASRIGP